MLNSGALRVLIVSGVLVAGIAASEAQDPQVAPNGMIKPTVLTEQQLTGFFAAVDELKQTGQAGAPAQPGQAEAFARALQVSGASTAILEKNGFSSVEDFQRVAYNAALAYGVLKEGGTEAVARKMAQSKAQQAQALDKMRQHMSEQQVQALAAQMNSAMGLAASLQDVPPQNVTLIEKYADRMRALEAK